MTRWQKELNDLATNPQPPDATVIRHINRGPKSYGARIEFLALEIERSQQDISKMKAKLVDVLHRQGRCRLNRFPYD